jgi:hypothetical protein
MAEETACCISESVPADEVEQPNAAANGTARAAKEEKYSAFEVALITRLTAIETTQGTILTKVDGICTAISQHDRDIGGVRMRLAVHEKSCPLIEGLRKEVEHLKTDLKTDETRVKGSASWRRTRDTIVLLALFVLALLHAPDFLKYIHVP